MPARKPAPKPRGECTTDEAAVYLQVSPGHIRKLIERGDLEARKPSRDLLISWSSILKYERNRRPVGRPEGTITGESHNKRGERETAYQRDYKRKLRAALAKKASKKGGKGRSKAKKATETKRTKRASKR